MVKLTVVPVIPLALSEAMKTAMFAISSSVMSRRGWVLLASNSCHCSQVIPEALARGSNRSSGSRAAPTSARRSSTTSRARVWLCLRQMNRSCSTVSGPPRSLLGGSSKGLRIGTCWSCWRSHGTVSASTPGRVGTWARPPYGYPVVGPALTGSDRRRARHAGEWSGVTSDGGPVSDRPGAASPYPVPRPAARKPWPGRGSSSFPRASPPVPPRP
jgi:hypothetical protein